MPKSGGSATIYGILYQLLGSAHWAARIHLSTVSDNETWIEARLVIEPAGGGGDTRVVSQQRRIVDQWKAKSNKGAWSLRTIIGDVLPDLYRAVDLARQGETKFRFVTEGHKGRWNAADRFFAELSRKLLPDDPLAILDDQCPLEFFPNEAVTERAFFDSILTSLRTHPDIAKDSDIESARKLWHLLSRFVFHGDQTVENLTIELDGLLRPLVDYHEQAEAKRRELCGVLLELASGGDATFEPKELLAKVDLDKRPFYDWVGARGAILGSVLRTLSNRWHYQREFDVRQSVRIAAHNYIHVLSGESGQGKTWCLASLARDAFAHGFLAIAVSATGDADRDLQNAANIMWRSGFDREGPTDIELVAKKRVEFLPRLPNPWMILCVDDVQSVTEARRLIERDWTSMGIRLAITSLPPVAQALKTQFADEIEVVNVDDFSIYELRSYLETFGYDWGEMPDDVRAALRRPLLAKIYCDLAEQHEWRDANEYALFSRYWQRIRTDRNQADYPEDVEVMRQLASTFLRDRVVYPWSRAECKTCGLSSDALLRLESIGWLRRVDRDRVEVVHDRLLNWAVAEAIIEGLATGDYSVDDVCVRVQELYRHHSVAGSDRTFGYVPMDVCWLMSKPGSGLKADLPMVIAALEDDNSLWNSETLYANLLPTLGPRIIEPMVDRVRCSSDNDETAGEPSLLSRFPCSRDCQNRR